MTHFQAGQLRRGVPVSHLFLEPVDLLLHVVALLVVGVFVRAQPLDVALEYLRERGGR